ncbi:MAG: hypothetical protein LBM77_02200 [Spirochaetaceae bacterium]|jgi:hypothetical protein|nr:hypothetical protein [Spirochaetaceae bacterium]
MEAIQNPRKKISLTGLFKSISKLGLESDTEEKLINLFLRNPRDRMISSRDISVFTGLPITWSLRILNILKNNDVIEFEPLLCPHCESVIANIPQTGMCPVCSGNLELDRNIVAFVPGTVDDKEDKEMGVKASRKRKLQILTDAWRRNGAIYYMIIDMVSSEAIQNYLQDEAYTFLLAQMREIVSLKAFSHTRAAYFSFGEIGDMFKIGFESLDDAIETAMLISKNFPERPKTLSSEILFPRYAGSVSKLVLPQESGHIMEPESLITETLNGTVDINSIALTQIFRFDNTKKTKYSVYKKRCDISLWCFTPLNESRSALERIETEHDLEHIELSEDYYQKFEYDKNGVKGESGAFLMYIKNGDINSIETKPKSILEGFDERK